MTQPDHPPESDFLLGPAEDWWNNACLNWSRATWVLYADGYKRAAERLVAAALARECPPDTIIFPIAFLYRHYLELQLKRIVVLARRLADLPVVLPHGHRIDELWKQVRTALREAEIPDGAPEFDRVTTLIGELAGVDAAGQGFRYPIDSQGNATLNGLDYINIRNFAERMNEIVSLVDGHDGMLEHYLDLKHEMEADARDAAGY